MEMGKQSPRLGCTCASVHASLVTESNLLHLQQSIRPCSSAEGQQHKPCVLPHNKTFQSLSCGVLLGDKCFVSSSNVADCVAS